MPGEQKWLPIFLQAKEVVPERIVVYNKAVIELPFEVWEFNFGKVEVTEETVVIFDEISEVKWERRMMSTTIETIKALRAKYGFGLKMAKEVYNATGGDLEKVDEYLKGIANMEKPHEVSVIFTYSHPKELSRIGVMLELGCTTDFVAKNEQFQYLGNELALQLAAGLEDEFLNQPYIRNGNIQISDLINQYSIKLGEPIVLIRKIRWQIGEQK